ncbi:hypothetical protein SAMN05444920_12096 [Nonomuraea solani]|uniref:Uncharacterized protein n=1 Tax=Nonomuraea solani TaxID=1144553 RepID=A0A1H6EUC4_9ACTN|nr:hypothetical protein [Nonomuraea solani]SEH01392.1 hypothetical protein SAMN05444920_12096 [Nonomuraea solani]
MHTRSRRRIAVAGLACAVALTGTALAESGLSYADSQQQRQTVQIRQTKGDQVVERARANFLVPDASVKADVDVLKVALREVKKGKSVAFNIGVGKEKIASALGTLGKDANAAEVLAQWTDLGADRARAGTAAYTAKERKFFGNFTTPLTRLTQTYPKSQAKYWLKNTPPQVVDSVFAAATADLPADQLYVYAYKEGLVDYVRDQIGLAKTADPTVAQLEGVRTTSTISGYVYLGTDDFFTDLTAAKKPASSFLPPGFDLKKVALDRRTNEKGREVQSARFPNLRMGLQGLAALVRRHRALFLADVKTYGYAAPTQAELVYWTYVYFNAGEFNGQLKKYAGARRLGDWIARGEYPNSIRVLESWRMINSMKIF